MVRPLPSGLTVTCTQRRITRPEGGVAAVARGHVIGAAGQVVQGGRIRAATQRGEGYRSAERTIPERIYGSPMAPELTMKATSPVGVLRSRRDRAAQGHACAVREGGLRQVEGGVGTAEYHRTPLARKVGSVRRSQAGGHIVASAGGESDPVGRVRASGPEVPQTKSLPSVTSWNAQLEPPAGGNEELQADELCAVRQARSKCNPAFPAVRRWPGQSVPEYQPCWVPPPKFRRRGRHRPIRRWNSVRKRPRYRRT